jgi:ribonuclease VapC
MIVDTSAIVAILRREPDWRVYSQAIEADKNSSISAVSYLETSIVIDSKRDAATSQALDRLIESGRIEIEPFSFEQARIARQAYRDYGRGSGHPANLNFGDCFSYALARVKREPILFKGDDFSQTDLRSAVEA